MNSIVDGRSSIQLKKWDLGMYSSQVYLQADACCSTRALLLLVLATEKSLCVPGQPIIGTTPMDTLLFLELLECCNLDMVDFASCRNM